MSPLAHARTEVAIHRLDDDVEVVVHQAVGVANPVVALADLPEQGQPGLAIRVVKKDRLAPVAPRGDVEQAAWKFDA